MKARILIMTTIEDSAGNTIAEMTSHFTGMLGDNPRYLTEALEAAQQAAYRKHLLRWGGVAWDWELTNVEGRFMPDEYTDAWGGRKSKTPVAMGPGTNTGHGHVWPRPDGVQARCGGPGICPVCQSHQRLVRGMNLGTRGMGTTEVEVS